MSEQDHWTNLIATEFAKPQFMTTTAGGGNYSINFSFTGPDARERCHALEDAFRAAGRAINGPAPCEWEDVSTQQVDSTAIRTGAS